MGVQQRPRYSTDGNLNRPVGASAGTSTGRSSITLLPMPRLRWSAQDARLCSGRSERAEAQAGRLRVGGIPVDIQEHAHLLIDGRCIHCPANIWTGPIELATVGAGSDSR
jgi:hypothetical protein